MSKASLIFLVLLFYLTSVLASSQSKGVPLGLQPDVPVAPPVKTKEYRDAEKGILRVQGRCIRWKKVCGYRKQCLYRQPMKKNGCWICRKARGARHTWNLYPRETVRQTCDFDRTTYLKSVGYQCQSQYRMGKCSRSRKIKYCDDLCTKVADSVNN